MYIYIYICIHIWRSGSSTRAEPSFRAVKSPQTKGSPQASRGAINWKAPKKRATSAPAEGPACGLDFARPCEFPLRTLLHGAAALRPPGGHALRAPERGSAEQASFADDS